MNVVGLKGFGLRYGRIDKYFAEGWFPYRIDWKQRHVDWLMRQYRKQYGLAEYMLIGFSDGGTLAYELAAADPWCAGLIVHSGMWRGLDEPLPQPVLLLTTTGDRTPTYEATFRAYHDLDDMRCEVTFAELVPKSYAPKHQFANGLAVMYRWAFDHFDFDLPVRPDWLQFATNVDAVYE
jgi:pimeloyl-ACP methyl ester carboxylesterase